MRLRAPRLDFCVYLPSPCAHWLCVFCCCWCCWHILLCGMKARNENVLLLYITHGETCVVYVWPLCLAYAFRVSVMEWSGNTREETIYALCACLCAYIHWNGVVGTTTLPPNWLAAAFAMKKSPSIPFIVGVHAPVILRYARAGGREQSGHSKFTLSSPLPSWP